MSRYLDGVAVKAAVYAFAADQRETKKPVLRDEAWRAVRYATEEEIRRFEDAEGKVLDPQPYMTIDGILVCLDR